MVVLFGLPDHQKYNLAKHLQESLKRARNDINSGKYLSYPVFTEYYVHGEDFETRLIN